MLNLVWPYTRGTARLVTLALTYGASAGAMAIGESADVGQHTDMYFTIVSLCTLAGPLISGAINHSTRGYTAAGILSVHGCDYVGETRAYNMS